MTCTSSSGTDICKINSSGIKGSYSAFNAPLIIPVNTSGYSAMKSPTSYSYSQVSNFLEKGIIYIYTGCRVKLKEENHILLELHGELLI